MIQVVVGIIRIKNFKIILEPFSLQRHPSEMEIIPLIEYYYYYSSWVQLILIHLRIKRGHLKKGDSTCRQLLTIVVRDSALFDYLVIAVT